MVPSAGAGAVTQVGAVCRVQMIAIALRSEALAAETAPVHRTSDHRGRSQTTAATACQNDREIALISAKAMTDGTIAVVATAMA